MVYPEIVQLTNKIIEIYQKTGKVPEVIMKDFQEIVKFVNRAGMNEKTVAEFFASVRNEEYKKKWDNLKEELKKLEQ